jgi:hypothetical protein
MHMILVGGGSAPQWVLLNFQTSAETSISQPEVRWSSTPGRLTACVPATGTAPIRRATLAVSANLFEGARAPEEFGALGPPQGLALVGMRAVSRCPAGLT